jgi:asparagine synthase (glutamine-hydrolysing)
MEPYLPSEVLYRPKMGFAVPLAKWFRGPLRERVRASLLGSHLADTGYFNLAYLEHLVSRHDSGARDYSAAIWTLLMFDAFLGSALDASHGARDLRLAG